MRKTVVLAALVAALAVAVAVSERQYIQRYLSFEGDPLTVPMEWYEPTETVPGNQLDDLPIAAADERTVASDALEQAAVFAAAQNSQALIVVHRGVVQLERYWDGADRESRFNPQSMAKSVLGLLMGIALQKGHIESLDSKVGTYIEEWTTDPRGDITIQQALRMAAGLKQMAKTYDNSFFSRGTRYNFGDNFDGMILDLKLNDPPGTRYQYNNEETNLLGMVIERATGQRYAEFLGEMLWQPLGLADAEMYLDRAGGSVMKSCCIFSRPYDWAKLGQLVLNRGMYNGEQIVPADWIDLMVTPSPLKGHYGLQIFLGDGYVRDGESAAPGSDDAFAPEGYVTDDMVVFLGFGGQRVWISARHKLVIVRGAVQWPTGWVETRIPNIIINALSATAPADKALDG